MSEPDSPWHIALSLTLGLTVRRIPKVRSPAHEKHQRAPKPHIPVRRLPERLQHPSPNLGVPPCGYRPLHSCRIILASSAHPIYHPGPWDATLPQLQDPVKLPAQHQLPGTANQTRIHQPDCRSADILATTTFPHKRRAAGGHLVEASASRDMPVSLRSALPPRKPSRRALSIDYFI